MAWQETLVLMLRYTVNDVDYPTKYSDIRLQTMLTVAGKFVASELNFSQVFKTDPIAITISPDPTIDPTVDDWYSNLTVIKSAIIMLQNEMRLLSTGALMFKEGTSVVDMREGIKYKAALLKDLLDQYTNAKMTYSMAIRPSCSSVIGPFNILAGNFRGPIYPYTQRDRLFI